MSICILSMQRVKNFGSVLQAYSLKKIIDSITGGDASFIDIKSISEDKVLLDKTNDYSLENGKKNTSEKLNKYLLNRVLRYRDYKAQIEILKRFQHDTLKLNSPSRDNYDVCVIGSDEVFNCLQPSEWGYTSQLFGNVDCASKVVSYAASCGSTNALDLSDSMITSINLALNRMSNISVRDQNTYDFVKTISGRDSLIHLDPVMIGDFDEEMDRFYKPKEKYCLIYSYYNRIHSEREIEAITSFCEKKKLKIISVFAPQFWIKEHVVLHPFEMLNYFKNAEFVITDTFHGAIFSAKYANRFGIITRESNMNKLADLIKRIGVSDHIVSDKLDFDALYQLYDDKEHIHIIENYERKRTKEYLIDALVH